MKLETSSEVVEAVTLEEEALLLSWQRVILELDRHQVLATNTRQLDAFDFGEEDVERHDVLLQNTPTNALQEVVVEE